MLRTEYFYYTGEHPMFTQDTVLKRTSTQNPDAAAASEISGTVGGTRVIPGLRYRATLRRDLGKKNAENIMQAIIGPRGQLMLCYLKNGEPSGGFELSAFVTAHRLMPPRY